jgi:hypothetical protein
MNDKRVQIVKRSDGEVVWESKPTYERDAEKIANGAGINLNWDEYSVHIVGADGEVA